MLCEFCSFLPVYKRIQLILWFPCVSALLLEAAIKLKEFNLLLSKDGGVQTYSFVRRLCDSWLRLLHGLVCCNHYQPNIHVTPSGVNRDHWPTQENRHQLMCFCISRSVED